MFFRSSLLIFSISLVSAVAAEPAPQQAIGPIPEWVRQYDFPVEPVPAKPSQVNVQYLLIDTQRNWNEKTLYRHFAIRALTQNGVEAISQLNIDFEPSYANVIMHAVRIFRDGEWHDRLASARSHVIQREEELDQNLYNGDLTLVYFLNDIREGDLLEYSYSTVGYNPLFASHYTDFAFLQREYTVEKIVHRLVAAPDLSFQIKPINTSVEPTVSSFSPSLGEWVWEATDTPAYEYESHQPAWYNPFAHVEMSQYQTWGELVQKLLPLYALPDDFQQSIPLEMQALVDTWKAQTSDPAKRALLALRFVQDEIRYLGIEEGMGALQPNAPTLIFQRRFGDCKDKTFLLHAFLRLMHIPSSPLLVHSSRGKRLPNVLPMPIFFNHLVLQLEIDGATYWVDPTFSLQGGSLETTFFPNYEWGLCIAEGSEALTPLPRHVIRYPTMIDTSCTLASEDIAHFKTQLTVHDLRADWWRRSLAWNGLKAMTDDFLSDLQEVYGAATFDASTEVADDRSNNALTFTFSYRLPTKKSSETKALEIFSSILRHYLIWRVNPERTAPYAIAHPLWVKEHIHIDNPFTQWKALHANHTQEHESLFYALATHIDKNSADFDLELKHLQDHIPQSALRDYWDLVNDIRDHAPRKMVIASPPASIHNELLPSVIACALALLALAAVARIRARQRARFRF